ncbi:MAG: hypothetical protein E7269_05710 [Lachnospiraceae bacterium]|nr:hypothetical protein [Lachnospiraceae bacterium]
MNVLNYRNNFSCTGIAIVASLILGIISAFLQITAAITVTTPFLWVVFGIAVVYLAVTLIAASLTQRTTSCRCSTLNAVLIGILGTILFAVILLAIEFAATSIIGAIITGTLLFFFSLMITTTACLVKCLVNCNN